MASFLKFPLTKAEYDILVYLRRKPRTAKEIRKKCKPNNGNQWNMWLTDLHEFYYVEPDSAKVLNNEGTLHLNDIGKTIAQAEFDRRFDMYYNRVIAMIALVLSIAAIIATIVTG